MDQDHERELGDYRAELRECATMEDVDAVLALLSTEPGEVLQMLRQEELERRDPMTYAAELEELSKQASI